MFAVLRGRALSRLEIDDQLEFQVPPTQRKIASRRRFCRLGGTLRRADLSQHEVGLSLDARPWLPGAAEVGQRSSPPGTGARAPAVQ